MRPINLFPPGQVGDSSTDAVERLVRLHAITAAKRAPPSDPPNSTRTCFGIPAQCRCCAGIDTAVIALWLGHADIRSTGIYLHTDLTIKQRALSDDPASTKPGCYRPATNFSVTMPITTSIHPTRSPPLQHIREHRPGSS